MAAPKKPVAKKPVVKKEVRKIELPAGLEETFKAKPSLLVAYLFSNGVWRFNKVYADAAEGDYKEIKNPFGTN